MSTFTQQKLSTSLENMRSAYLYPPEGERKRATERERERKIEEGRDTIRNSVIVFLMYVIPIEYITKE